MDIAKHLQDHDIPFIKMGIVDLHGILRGKIISRNKLIKGLQSDLSFCDVIIGSDVNDQLCDNMNFTGWHTGYPDAGIHIIPESYRHIPWEDKGCIVLCEFSDEFSSICSRSLLKKVIAKAKAMGFKASAALEYEFSIFQETPASLQEKNFRQLTPFTPGNFGYSLLRSSQCHEFYEDLLSSMSAMKIPIEGLHTEIGPGVLEAAITYSDILTAADRAVFFKTFTKVIAERHGLVATFMAKPSMKMQGQGGHIHLSLQDEHDNPVFYDHTQANNMSKIMQHFIAGQQQLMPELLALSAPNINSFARLVPGYWAPTNATWGIDNRTCALRAIPGSEQSLRVEYRIGGADSNPYLALAAALASGLHGIDNALTPDEPVIGNAYEADSNEHLLPHNLEAASEALFDSQCARDLFGNEFIDDYCALCDWESRQYQRSVNDWQLQRYFEAI